VTTGENESISIWPVRLGGFVIENVKVERGVDVGHTKRASTVTRASLFEHGNNMLANPNRS
jgi:hypothetical protein